MVIANGLFMVCGRQDLIRGRAFYSNKSIERSQHRVPIHVPYCYACGVCVMPHKEMENESNYFTAFRHNGTQRMSGSGRETTGERRKLKTNKWMNDRSVQEIDQNLSVDWVELTQLNHDFKWLFFSISSFQSRNRSIHICACMLLMFMCVRYGRAECNKLNKKPPTFLSLFFGQRARKS